MEQFLPWWWSVRYFDFRGRSRERTSFSKVLKLVILPSDDTQEILDRLHGRVHEVGQLLPSKLGILLLGVLEDGSELGQLALDHDCGLGFSETEIERADRPL